MGKVITLINENGGIGKTSLIFNTAWELSRGSKVLMIDLDGQKGNLTFFSGIKAAEITMYDVLERGKDIKDAIQNVKKGLDLIPADNDVTSISQKSKMTYMKKLMSSLKRSYDYIFIDVNPNPDWRHFLTLTSADFILIPMRPDPKALEGSNGIIESIMEAKEYNRGLKILGMVINLYDKRTALGKDVIEAAEKRAVKLKGKVFKSKIRRCVALSENVQIHEGVTDYAPSSNAAADIKEFVKELKKEVQSRG